KTDEIAGMARVERHADLALCLEPADAGTVACTRIDDHERPLGLVNMDTSRWSDACQNVIHRTRQRAPVHHQLGAKLEHVRGELGDMLLAVLTALPHDIEEQDAALNSVEPIDPRVPDKIGCPRRERRVRASL